MNVKKFVHAFSVILTSLLFVVITLDLINHSHKIESLIQRVSAIESQLKSSPMKCSLVEEDKLHESSGEWRERLTELERNQMERVQIDTMTLELARLKKLPPPPYSPLPTDAVQDLPKVSKK